MNIEASSTIRATGGTFSRLIRRLNTGKIASLSAVISPSMAEVFSQHWETLKARGYESLMPL